MFFSNRAFSVLRSVSRCSGDKSLVLLFVLFMLVLLGATRLGCSMSLKASGESPESIVALKAPSTNESPILTVQDTCFDGCRFQIAIAQSLSDMSVVTMVSTRATDSPP